MQSRNIQTRTDSAAEATAGPTFPPPGWCFMLSVEPTLERTLRTSGAGAVAGRVVVLEVVVAVAAETEEAGRGARDTGGFFSGAVPAAEEDAVAGLAAVVRVREAVVVTVEAVLRVVVTFGLLESAEGREQLYRGGVITLLYCIQF